MDRPSLGICSWSLRPQSIDELIAALRRVGVTSVQLALTPLVEPRLDDWESCWGSGCARLRDAGIEIASGMLETVGEDYTSLASIKATGGVRPDATWIATLARAQQVAHLAEAEGISLVTLHAGFIPHETDDPTRRTILARLRVLADLFAAHGASIAFETGQETAATLVDALRELDRASVGVNFDPANMILYGMGDPVAALAALAPSVRQIHIKDARPSATPGEWGSEVPAGEGAVDWNAFFAVANAQTPTCRYVIEREAGESRERDIERAVALLQRTHCAQGTS